jgi:hypothetical protein
MASETGVPQPAPSFLDGVWQLFSDLRTTLVLAAFSAVALVLSAFIPQSRDGLRVAEWVLLALLAYSLALRLAAHFAHALRLRTPQPALLPPTLPAATVTLYGPLAALQTRTASVMAADYRLIPPANAGAPPDPIYGVSRPGAIIGPILAVLGPLLCLGGLLANTLWGWNEPDLLLTRGVGVALPQHGGVQLALEQTDPPTVAVTRPGIAPIKLMLTGGRPALALGVWIVQRDSGPALDAIAQDAAGRSLDLAPLADETIARPRLQLAFSPTQTEQTFSVPEAGILWRVVSYPALPERNVAGPVFLAEAYREGEADPAFSALVEDQASLTLDGITYSLVRSRYLILQAVSLPGWPLLTIGALLAIVGLAVALAFPVKEAWISLRPAHREVVAGVYTTGGLHPVRDAATLAAALAPEEILSP